VRIASVRRVVGGTALVLGLAASAHAQAHGAPEATKAAPAHAGAAAATHAEPKAKPEDKAKAEAKAPAEEPHGEKAAKPAGTVKAHDAATAPAPARGSLAALPGDVDQIRKRMAEAGGGTTRPAARTASPPAPAVAGPPVRLVWRQAVVWPAEIRPAAHASGRILLVWHWPAGEPAVAAGTK